MKLKFKWSSNLNNFFVAICGMVSNLVSVIRYFSKIDFEGGFVLEKNGSYLPHDSISQIDGNRSKSKVKAKAPDPKTDRASRESSGGPAGPALLNSRLDR